MSSTTNNSLKITISKDNILSHLIVWSLLIAYLFYITKVEGSVIGKILYCGIIYINYIITFYLLILFVFPRFWQTNKFKFLICFLIVQFNFYLIGYLNWFYIWAIFISKIEIEFWLPTSRFLNRYSVWSFVICLVATSYYFRKLRLYKIQIQNEKETGLLKRELSLFRSQFNPHITFNFLNHIYSIANKHSVEAAKAIEIYSDMLRHYTNHGANEAVAVKNEVKYISNYIELRRILSKKVFVNFTTNCLNKEQIIYPRILINFVENAFKHGVYSDKDRPVEISFSVTDRIIKFTVKNTINRSRNVVSSSIGLKNSMQLLSLHYEGNYELVTEEKDDMYFVELKIKVEK